LGVLQRAQQKGKDHRDDIQLYDFDFHAWPVDFRSNESTVSSNVTYQDLRDKHDFHDVLSWPSRLLQYVLVHALGRPMAYPGSVKLLQLAMNSVVLEGRTVLIEKNGLRAKLLSEDGNEIDTMFLDKRGDENDGVGNTLVINCEGNAAYYEVGCMATPMKAGYSVLGWNHPGFFGSTGSPNAESERHAIDVVVKYAVTRLGFPVDSIIMFAWSIGGFPASYAAMMYPDMKALILDATFDHITELALNRMPGFAESLVLKILRNYLDLDVGRHCVHYPGPIRLIRRQREEIITSEPGIPSTNRGNDLLLCILRHRYPKIFVERSIEIVRRFLSANDAVEQSAVVGEIGGINLEACEIRLTVDNNVTYPLEIGEDWSMEEKVETALCLCRLYMSHYDASHCMPLPSTFFKLPWKHRVDEVAGTR